jgi:hypothetical protein
MSTLDPSLVPFWLSRTMHAESIVFITRTDGPGEGRLDRLLA